MGPVTGTQSEASGLCCAQATRAYLAGNKALARELSARGREHGERMSAEHQAAAARIFDARNAPHRGAPRRADIGCTPQNAPVRPKILKMADIGGLHAAVVGGQSSKDFQCLGRHLPCSADKRLGMQS